MEKYQQGDVVMFKVDEEYFKKHTRTGKENQAVYGGGEDTHAIVAFGEVTGHKHQVNMKDMAENVGVTLSMGYNRQAGVDVPEGFAVIDAPVTITHEEHNPIELPPGYYMVRIVQEFDHIAGRSQNVAD
jgi:hypothetical protein